MTAISHEQKKEFKVFIDLLCEEAAKEILRHYGPDVKVEHKSDATPVTIADRNAEKHIRQIINKRYPDHGIIGEEHGTEKVDAAFVWVLDPVDGTKSFISGVPLFATLVALLHNGRPIIGAINQPVLKHLRTSPINGSYSDHPSALPSLKYSATNIWLLMT